MKSIHLALVLCIFYVNGIYAQQNIEDFTSIEEVCTYNSESEVCTEDEESCASEEKTNYNRCYSVLDNLECKVSIIKPNSMEKKTSSKVTLKGVLTGTWTHDYIDQYQDQPTFLNYLWSTAMVAIDGVLPIKRFDTNNNGTNDEVQLSIPGTNWGKLIVGNLEDGINIRYECKVK